MKPLFVRVLSGEERRALRAGLRSPDSFTLRCCQILLASARGKPVSVIARALGCSTQTVRNAIWTFAARGAASLSMRSRRPKSAAKVFDAERCERLRALLHQSPRAFGKAGSTWTLASVAEACVAQGITARPVSIETIRQALLRLDVSWRRAKRWLTSPDPRYALKKSSGIG